ncbi:MAG: hypothetical protein LBJ35_03335 [Spirochaetaceae bacterium]|jgi:hypothetical protein|nr:hypothetical protein [Spirochaetaceae bacterium]
MRKSAYLDVAAASAWEGDRNAPAVEGENELGGGGGDKPQYSWYLNNPSITGVGKAISYIKAVSSQQFQIRKNAEN